MASHLSASFAFLLLVVVASDAALPSAVYWNTLLQDVPMPKAVLELLQSGHGEKAVNNYEHNFHDYGDSGFFFFLKKDLHPGKKMNAYLKRDMAGTSFISREQASAVPFSSNKLSEIMSILSIKPHSREAEAMKQTLRKCERPSAHKEDKYCATSLESMIDFSMLMLGPYVQAMSTHVDNEETVGQQYTIAEGVERIGGENNVVCHIQTYAYPVYYCHEIKSTQAYKVPLVDAEGKKGTAVAVCHHDTSKWSPMHMAFQVLKVRPGDVRVCHFLSEGDIVWTSNYKTASDTSMF